VVEILLNIKLVSGTLPCIVEYSSNWSGWSFTQYSIHECTFNCILEYRSNRTGRSFTQYSADESSSQPDTYFM